MKSAFLDATKVRKLGELLDCFQLHGIELSEHITLSKDKLLVFVCTRKDNVQGFKDKQELVYAETIPDKHEFRKTAQLLLNPKKKTVLLEAYLLPHDMLDQCVFTGMILKSDYLVH